MDEAMIFAENLEESIGGAARSITAGLPSPDGLLSYAENLGED